MYVYGGFSFYVYNIIYYKTPFVKERLLDTFGHNAEFTYFTNLKRGLHARNPLFGLAYSSMVMRTSPLVVLISQRPPTVDLGTSTEPEVVSV